MSNQKTAVHTRHTLIRKVGGILIALALIGCTAETAEDGDSEFGTHESGLAYTTANRIYFLNANLMGGSFGENGKDGRNFMAWAAQSARPYVPDIITLQEMRYGSATVGYTNLHWCQEFADLLSAYISSYSGLNPNYAAERTNTGGGACILYRPGRFTKVSAGTVLAHAGLPCTGGSAMTAQTLKLTDILSANKVVQVASLHLPLGSVGGLECIDSNLANIRNNASMSGTTGLKIIAGDFNAQYPRHYSDLANAGYTLVPMLAPDGSENTTANTGRIDFVWLKNHASYANNQLVPWESARFVQYGGQYLDYSDHRGFATVINY